MALIRLNVILILCQLKFCSLNGFAISSDTNSKSKCNTGKTTSVEWTIPKVDTVLEKGNPLEIYCSLDWNDSTMKNYTSEDIVFKRNGEKIDKTRTFAVNSTTVQLYMKDLPISVEKEYFSCSLQLRDPYSDIVDPSLVANNGREHLICSRSVLIGSKPKELIDFICYNYNWRSLSCTWNEPNNGVKTNYAVSYYIPRKNEKIRPSYKCPQQEKNKCTWSTNSQPAYRPFFPTIFFKIHASNEFGYTTQTIRFDNFKKVIPDAPTEVVALSKTAHSVYLQWNIGRWTIFDDMFLDYRVSFTPSWKNRWVSQEYLAKDVEKRNDVVRVNVTGFEYSNTLYEVEIYMKSQLASEQCCWSPPASVLVKTDSTYWSPDG